MPHRLRQRGRPSSVANGDGAWKTRGFPGSILKVLLGWARPRLDHPREPERLPEDITWTPVPQKAQNNMAFRSFLVYRFFFFLFACLLDFSHGLVCTSPGAIDQSFCQDDASQHVALAQFMESY